MSEGGLLAIHIAEDSDVIAKQIVEDLILPVLCRKTVHSGEISAGNLYLSLMYFLARGRAGVVGHDAVHELHGLASDIEEDCFDENGNPHSRDDLSNFIQLSGKPS